MRNLTSKTQKPSNCHPRAGGDPDFLNAASRISFSGSRSCKHVLRTRANGMTILLAMAIIMIAPLPTHAESFTYAPEHCDTEVTFSEKPFIETKCLGKECSEIVTFTKIVQPDASLNVRVTCVDYPKEELDTYTQEVVEETLKRLLKDQNMGAFDISSDEADGIRRSTSMSVGTKDNVPYIYTGQIWIGKQSMFTIEAQMKGPQNDQIEKTFAEILKATHAKEASGKK